MAGESTNQQQYIPESDRNSSNDGSLQLSDIWALIIENKVWFATCIIVCLMFAAFYKYKTASVYQQTAKIIIDESAANSAMRDLSNISEAFSGVKSSGGINVNNEIEYISSPDLMQVVVERLGLQTRYFSHQPLRIRELYNQSPFAVSLSNPDKHSYVTFKITGARDSMYVITDLCVTSGGKIAKVPGFTMAEGHFGDTLSTPVANIMVVPTVNYEGWKSGDVTVTWTTSAHEASILGNNLNVSLSNAKSSVVNISMKDNFPSRASAVISSLIDAYNEACIDNQNRSARNTTQFINDRLVVIEKELGGVENELKNYKEEHKITDISAVSQSYLTASSSYQDKSFEVNNQLSIARYIKEYLTSPANSRSLIPANSGLTNESINSQIKEYNDLLLKRDRLLGSSSVKNPVVSDINQSLDAMKAAINHSVDNLIATLQMQVDKLNSQESLIMSRIANTSGQELQLLSIERQQKVKEELYVYLLQKREENEIASLVNVGNTRIIMTPNGSASPVFPKSMILLLVALMAGFLIPLGVLLAMNLLNTKVHSQSDLPSLQAPFLASIPLVGQPNSLLKRMRPRKNVHAPAHILVKQGSRDSLNEAFRVLRTNVDMMLGARKSVIMVTSYNPNAGKSFISLNTAAVMALKGKKVLLMDADLRKATLGKSLRSNENGYVSYLNGRKGSFTESVRSLAENLYFLPVGVLPPNPSELLLGDKFKGMLAELKKEFDYIIMDCPPIDIVADASILSPETDFTIFVIRAGLFDKRDVGMLNDMYNRKRFKEMAIILNGVDFSTVYQSYGHYGYGHYGYGNYGYGYGNEGSGNPGAQEDGKA